VLHNEGVSFLGPFALIAKVVKMLSHELCTFPQVLPILSQLVIIQLAAYSNHPLRRIERVSQSSTVFPPHGQQPTHLVLLSDRNTIRAAVVETSLGTPTICTSSGQTTTPRSAACFSDRICLAITSFRLAAPACQA